MIVLVAFDVFEVGEEVPFYAPLGMFTDLEIATAIIGLKFPDLVWNKVIDEQNLRIIWQGKNDLGAIIQIVPFPMNALFAYEGEVLNVTQ